MSAGFAKRVKNLGDSRACPAHNRGVKLTIHQRLSCVLSVLGSFIWCGILVSVNPVRADEGWIVAWLRAASGPGVVADGIAPGWAWFHHSSHRAEGGPSPRIKYRDLYHTAGRLEAGVRVTTAGEFVRSAADGVVLLQGDGIELGMGPATEIRLKAGVVQLLSGEIWAECKTIGSGGQVKIQGNHVEVGLDECPAIVHLSDDEIANSSIRVGVPSGKVSFWVRVDGETSLTSNVLKAGEQVSLRFPGVSNGVDNQRFFSAMESEPEIERGPISSAQESQWLKLRSAPLPRPSSSPAAASAASKAGS
jgi:hypothetical protein